MLVPLAFSARTNDAIQLGNVPVTFRAPETAIKLWLLLLYEKKLGLHSLCLFAKTVEKLAMENGISNDGESSLILITSACVLLGLSSPSGLFFCFTVISLLCPHPQMRSSKLMSRNRFFNLAHIKIIHFLS